MCLARSASSGGLQPAALCRLLIALVMAAVTVVS